jgi:hypothetical protein
MRSGPTPEPRRCSSLQYRSRRRDR